MQIKPEEKLAERKFILERLKFGICPTCGHDTVRRFRRSHEPFDGTVTTSFIEVYNRQRSGPGDENL